MSDVPLISAKHVLRDLEGALGKSYNPKATYSLVTPNQALARQEEGWEVVCEAGSPDPDPNLVLVCKVPKTPKVPKKPTRRKKQDE